MANIKVVHKAAVISTELSVKDIKRLGAINPSALCVKNAEGEVVFAIGLGSRSEASKYGIVFNNDSKVSILIPSEGKVTKETVEELYGAMLLQLAKVEKQATEALTGIETDLEDLIEIEDLDEDTELLED